MKTVGKRNLGYWWQLAWRWIEQLIDKKLLNVVAPSSAEKEVINVLCASDEEPENPQDGDLYINTEEQLLYEYDEDEWVSVDANGSVVYLTNNTGHIYVYVNGEFKDATSEQIDNILYVTNLTTDLADVVNNGVYSVLCTSRFGSEAYTLAVTTKRGRALLGRPASVTITQTLQNYQGYQIRTKRDDEEWSEWAEYPYAYENEILEIETAEINALFE